MRQKSKGRGKTRQEGEETGKGGEKEAKGSGDGKRNTRQVLGLGAAYKLLFVCNILLTKAPMDCTYQ